MQVKKDTTLYRAMEIFPAVLSWGTFVLFIILSFLLPLWVAIFIILFDVYWFFKTMHFSLYLRNSYKKLRKNMRTSWLRKLQTDPQTKDVWKDVYHLVILPMYKEDEEVVRGTLEKLAQIRYPQEKLIVVLGLEERAGKKVQDMGKRMETMFKGVFCDFLLTIHPKDIPGETPGKGSNEAWAAKEAKEKIIDAKGIEYASVMVSVFDIDTQVYPQYFAILTYTFLTTPNRFHASYQPVPFFLNNVFEAPALSRIIGFSGTFWHLMQQMVPEKLVTFSSHSMPFQAVIDIGYWQRDIVSEDSRVFFQCLLRYDGNWRTVPLFYPVSMDANVAHSFFQTLINIYKQQRRWGWGSENIAFIAQGFRENKKIPTYKKIYWLFQQIEGFHSWATNAVIIFSLGWLPIFLGPESFRVTLLAYNLPSITQWIMLGASVGIITTAVLSIALLPPKPPTFRWYHYLWYLLSWALMPFSLIIFGSLPALEAQTRLALSGRWRLDFWVTPKHRKEKGD